MTFKKRSSDTTEDPASKRSLKHNPRSRPHLLKTAIKPGEVRNPNGRPKGSRNKLGEAFLQALCADFNDYGDIAIAQCRVEDPARYCAIIASILPKDLTINSEEQLVERFLEQFNTVEDIRAFRGQLAGLLARQTPSEEGTKTLPRK